MVFIKGFYGTAVHPDYKVHGYKAISLRCPELDFLVSARLFQRSFELIDSPLRNPMHLIEDSLISLLISYTMRSFQIRLK